MTGPQQRGKKRGPYKPRVPKTLGEAAVLAIETGEPQIVADPEPLHVEIKADASMSVEKIAQAQESIERLLPPIRFVRFRHGLHEHETCPAILFDDTVYAVLPAVVSAGVSLSFRASAGGWSHGPARKGDDVGQYQEA